MELVFYFFSLHWPPGTHMKMFYPDSNVFILHVGTWYKIVLESCEIHLLKIRLNPFYGRAHFSWPTSNKQLLLPYSRMKTSPQFSVPTFLRWPLKDLTDNNAMGASKFARLSPRTPTGPHCCMSDLLGARRKYGGHGKMGWRLCQTFKFPI